MNLKKKKFLMMLLCSKHRKVKDDGYEDNVIMTKDSNPQVLAICYANGLCQSPDIMYKEEAEAITDIGTLFKQSNIINFDELRYFTGLTTLKAYAFRDCNNLEHIILPETLVGTFTRTVFLNCSSLTEINIPSGITGFSDNIWAGTNIERVYITDMDAWCSMDCTNSPMIKANRLILNGQDVTHVVFPKHLSKINNYTFFNISTLKSIVLHDNVNELGDRCFSQSAIEHIDIPEGITQIPSYCFYRCENLKDVILPSTITTLKDRSFTSCDTLRSITIKAIQAPTFDGSYHFTNTGNFATERKLKVSRNATGYNQDEWLSLQTRHNYPYVLEYFD